MFALIRIDLSGAARGQQVVPYKMSIVALFEDYPECPALETFVFSQTEGVSSSPDHRSEEARVNRVALIYAELGRNLTQAAEYPGNWPL